MMIVNIQRNRMVVFKLLILLLLLLLVAASARSAPQLHSSSQQSYGASCKESYGVLPCSNKVTGSLFMLLIFSYIFLKSAQLLLNGSEQLLEVANPGIVGGLCLPVFCTIPDAAVILVSGMTTDKVTAQSQVMIGMGVLAGSTVLLLTILWGAALIVGRCDLYDVNDKKVAKSRTLTRGFHLTETGVTTNKQTAHLAWLLLLSIVPCVVVQIPPVLSMPRLKNVAVIAGCVISFIAFIGYCVYQVMTPWIQQSMIDWHRHRYRRSHALHRAHLYSRQNKWGDLLLNDGKLLNYDVLRRLFRFFDANGDGQLSVEELKNFITSLGLSKENMPEDQEAQLWMQEFDRNKDSKLSLSEFEQGMTDWLSSSQLRHEFVKRRSFKADRTVSAHWEEIAKEAQSSLTSLLEDDEGGNEDVDEDEESQPSSRSILTSAIVSLVGGATLACVFANPLVDAIDDFSRASNIPPFFVSFVITPLATSSSEALSSIAFASKKRKRSISVTYSQIYGSVILNNTLCLGLFLAIVAAHNLVWDFSSEMMIIGLVTVVMGLVGASFTTITLCMAFAAFSLYPFSLALVAVLRRVCGWH